MGIHEHQTCTQLFMPHAEKDTITSTTMGETLTNGEKPHSLFISHLTSYPLVSDSLSAYLENPYSYVAPYVQKADSLGDKGLSEVDSRFPIVKEETSSLKEKVKGLPFVPYDAFVSAHSYLLKTYEEQDKRNQGQKGVVPFAKTVIGTELKIAADTLGYLTGFIVAKKEEGKKFASAKIDELNEKTQSK